MEFVWPVRVYYEDTDAGGVVYHANYLKFMERARSEWLRQLGFEQDELIETKNVVFAVRRIEVNFIKPARFNASLKVHSRIVAMRRASIDFLQAVKLHADETLCEARVRIASLDARSLRVKRIPEAIKLMLE